MPDTLIPDWSEFQTVDHARASAWLRRQNGGGAAAIFRACYGASHVDGQIDYNLDHADAYDAVGLYAYLPAGADPRSTAQVAARVIRAHGGLRRMWFVIVDDEEGAGDQSSRVNACLDELDAQLQTPDPAGEDWWYSGLNFAILHDLPAARGRRWIAAYQAAEPAAPSHDLWQRTNAQVIDGVSGPCDCSVFHGSVADLLRLIGAGPTQPQEEDDVADVLWLPVDASGTHGALQYWFWRRREPDGTDSLIVDYYDGSVHQATVLRTGLRAGTAITARYGAAIDQVHVTGELADGTPFDRYTTPGGAWFDVIGLGGGDDAQPAPLVDVAALAAALAPHLQAVDETKLAADLEAALLPAEAEATKAAFGKALSA